MNHDEKNAADWIVSNGEAGMTLLSFLQGKKENKFSRKALKKAIDNKCCRINGRIELFSSHLLKKNDHIALRDFLQEKKARLPLLYEDEDLLIVDKPAGLVSENRFFAP